MPDPLKTWTTHWQPVNAYHHFYGYSIAFASKLERENPGEHAFDHFYRCQTPMKLHFVFVSILFAYFGSHSACVEVQQPLLPGVQDSGAIMLPTQWLLNPAGRQIGIGDLPVNMAVHPDGRWLAILCAGYNEHEVVVVDLTTQRLVSRTILPQGFYGLSFNKAGDRIYASGGEFEVVHSWSFADGLLGNPKQLRVAPQSEKYVPAGVAVAEDGSTIYAACPWGHSVCVMSIDNSTPPRHIAMPQDSYPYTVLLTGPNRGFVSLWNGSSVLDVDFAEGRVLRTIATDSHPTEMKMSPDGKRLFVACANSNSVYVINVESGKAVEVLTTSLYPSAPSGSTPCSIDLSSDGRVLLAANANNNTIAVIDVSKPGESRSLGFIPVGWYPTSVRFGPGGQILVANGKGIWPKSNRHGPVPTNGKLPPLNEYIGRLLPGTLGIIKPPSPMELAKYTRTAFDCSPLQDGAGVRNSTRPPDSPIPADVGAEGPIKYCFYVIKENRTYDQMLGDMPEGNGDKSLCLFPEKIAPNHHALAHDFVLLDNFYVESEVSADGHEWTMAAYANDFVEKAWPLNYRGGGLDKIGYPAEGKYELAIPKGGYLWDRCREAGVSYFSFGEWVNNGKTPNDPGTAAVPALEGHIDPMFRSFDLGVMDQKRADRFIEKLNEFAESGELPRLVILRLPNDHTSGTRVGKPTPTAMVADNDLALGRCVEAISKSKFWPQSAIFVVEDDAQNGSDHVDAHRTVALAVSPYTRGQGVDSNLYSTSSMLRTMELILGVKPMSQFDAAAVPMYGSFHGQPDNSPYECRTVEHDLYEKNLASAWGAGESERLDLAKEDAADDLLFGEIVWRSVKGADSPMPPPVRAGFVFGGPDEKGDKSN